MIATQPTKATLSVLLSFLLMSLTLILTTPLYGKTINIGVIGPYSGDLATYGIPVKNAVELGVEKLNKEGGILGKQVRLIALDDVCEPNTAITAANKILGENVVAVIGHLCSGATRSVLDLYRQAKVIVISAASTSPELTLDKKSPHFFRTIAHDAAQANLQVEFIKGQGFKKVAILHDKGTYGKGLADLVRDGLSSTPGNVEVSLYEGLDPKNVTYTTLIDKIAKNSSEAVVFGGYHPEAAKLIRSARQKKLMMPFISGDGVRNDKLIELAGESALGYYASAPVDTSQNSLAQAMITEYKTKYKSEPGTFSLQAYSALLVLKNAIETAKSESYQDILKALHSSKTSTPLGDISFDDQGDIVGSGFTMYKVEAVKEQNKTISKFMPVSK